MTCRRWFKLCLGDKQRTTHYQPTITKFCGVMIILFTDAYRRHLASMNECLTKVSSEIHHYYDVIMGTMASQITSLTIVSSTVYSGADQRKRHSSVSLAFVRGIHRSPVNSPHKGPVTRKKIPFDDVIMNNIAQVLPGSVSTTKSRDIPGQIKYAAFSEWIS